MQIFLTNEQFGQEQTRAIYCLPIEFHKELKLMNANI